MSVCSDVSTAVRLCDGALVVIDALEGICSQTHVVLNHAWAEGVQPCLILNKIDRRVVELQMTPMEAYQHVWRIIEQVNVIASQHLSAEMFAAADLGDEYDEGVVDEGEAKMFFSPAKGNVVFASAVDGWAFRCVRVCGAARCGGVMVEVTARSCRPCGVCVLPVTGMIVLAVLTLGSCVCWGCSLDTFAAVLAPRMELPRGVVRRALWGDYFYKPKTKKIVGPEDAPKGAEPLFVSKVFASIWAAYDAIALNHNPARVEKIVSSLSLTVDAREIAQVTWGCCGVVLPDVWIQQLIAMIERQ